MEFEIKGQQYRAAKLNVFEQLKISRKLLPLLSGLLSEISVIRQLKSGQISIEDAIKTALPAIAQALSDISEDDSNAIIHPCLAVVSVQQGKSYAPIFNNGQLMFDDIDLMKMLEIVARVVGDSLGNFLGELQEKIPEAPAVAPVQPAE
ncbi:phage tail assembly chaperone [Serratia bockelmannii]|uniref:phage tail assembly chaperone n=1 Tax=Serratia bockelmannii TaxID=2703793 RepID=UPI003F6A68B9